jgi:hypothetical protein
MACSPCEQRRREREALMNLLARIHRDGGHHTSAVGVEQSALDADAKVVAWIALEDEQKARNFPLIPGVNPPETKSSR